MREVHPGGIATDPNYFREYGDDVTDSTSSEPGSEPRSDPTSEPTFDAPAVPVTDPLETGYTSDGVPTFDYARERIETRYGTAIGSAELAAETPEGRSVAEQYEARQKAAADRLAQIRESMREPAKDDSPADDSPTADA